MPIPVTCPTRRRTFRVADRYAGRRGLCPGCRGVVAVPDTDLEPLEPVGEESAYDDRPRRARWNPERPPSRLDHLPAWRRIGLGFLIQQAAAGLYLVALALVGAAAVVLPDDPLDFDRQPTPGEVVAGAVGVCAALFAVILQLAGRYLSAQTPVRAPRAIGWFSATLTGVQLPAGCMVGLFAALAGMDQQPAGGQPDPAAAMLVGLGVFGWLALVVAAESCHGFTVGSVGRVLRADAARVLGRGLGVFAMVAGFLAIASLCAFGAWADANNPDGQDPAALRQENQLALGWFIGAAVVTGLYLMLDVVLLQQARAAIGRIGEGEEPERTADDWR